MKLGAEVTWTSQSAGIRTTKTGRIVAVVEARANPHTALMAAGIYGRVHGAGGWRDHRSYVVRTSTGRLRWPRVDLLRLVLAESPTTGDNE